MQVEKCRAKTIKAATDKVRKRLGPDAMIISTKRLEGSGGNNLFEITAMTVEDNFPEERSDLVKEVKREMMSIKEMFFLLNQSGGFMEKLAGIPGALSLYAKLLNNGVEDQYAKLFLEKTGAFNGNPVNNGKEIKDKALKEIMKVIQVRNPLEIEDKSRTIAAFIGTTGVGKTTTIAKLAAQLMLESKKKVGLISIDGYRIGAMDQLKTYANILGIPCFQAFKRKDLLFAIKRMEGRDVVLIDTAGQSQYDMSRIEELRKMIPGDLSITTHLLLGISTTGVEMNETAVNFSPLKYQSYIFTKKDEAQKCGSIINQIMKSKLPVSYVTTGQNVPEDIEKADKEKILKWIVSH